MVGVVCRERVFFYLSRGWSFEAVGEWAETRPPPRLTLRSPASGSGRSSAASSSQPYCLLMTLEVFTSIITHAH